MTASHVSYFLMINRNCHIKYKNKEKKFNLELPIEIEK